MKQTFDCSPMAFEWRMHKVGEFIQGKGNIRLSHPKMLEATNHLMVHGGIDRHNTIIGSKRSTYSKWCIDGFKVEHVMFA